MHSSYKTVDGGGITTPSGFKASGVTAGLKKNGSRDMALIFSEKPATAAGTFTTSLFPAAPVVFDKNLLLNNSEFHAVITNSGNANACTGPQGILDSEKTAAVAAEKLGIKPDQVFVCSTGRIGTPLPMDIIENGIALAVDNLSDEGGADAAEAIMTTDSVPKEYCVSLTVGGKKVYIGGMTKGAGMIAPKMSVPHATMLAYITTDAAVDKDFLQEILGEGVSESFNRITVDGDMSTNDTVLMLANGKAGNRAVHAASPDASLFRDALFHLLRELACSIVRDAEGATKFITVRVENAKYAKDAELCADAIANSLLCKTAWFGGDPNWGRVLAAAGYSGAQFNPDRVSLYYDSEPVVLNGEDAHTEEARLESVLKKNSFTVLLDLNDGNESYEMWTNDISYEYVKINAEYHT